MGPHAYRSATHDEEPCVSEAAAPSHGAGGDATTPSPVDVLLVTGSRVIIDAPPAWRRCRELIAEQVDVATTVVTGDARGPDAMAVEVARESGKRWASYCLDGLVRRGHGERVRWNDPQRDGDPPPRDGNRALRAAWCLVRDRVMVQRLVDARDAGRSVRVLAIVATWSETRGMDFTAQRAREAGVDVVRVEMDRAGSGA